MRASGEVGPIRAGFVALVLGVVLSFTLVQLFGTESEVVTELLPVPESDAASRAVGQPALGRHAGRPAEDLPFAGSSVDQAGPAVGITPAPSESFDDAAAAAAPTAADLGEAPGPTPAPPSQASPSTPATAPTTIAAAPTTAATAQRSATTTTTVRRSSPSTARPATTGSPTTAAAPQQVAAAPPVTIQDFTDWPIRNTSLDSRTQFVNTPASALDWRQFTEASDRSIALGSVAANKHLGQFRTQCSFSHYAYDDPIVFPGQPGVSHLHMFFGNSEANANSTYQSLRDSGSSTCNGFEGNRSAYWMPAVFDASGNARIPSRIELYYKSHDQAFSTVQKPPEGLAMVAGDASSNPFVEWGCQETGSQGTDLNRPVIQIQNTIPRCSGTATLLAHIRFPQCVSGNVSATSGNNTHQMSYPRNGYYSNSCPAGTQIITSIEFFIAWDPGNHDGRTNEWWIASDVLADGSRLANGSSLHADWFGAWNPDLMDKMHDSCIARLAECSWDLVDDNTRLQWVEHFGPKSSAAYTGPRTVSAQELSTKLCPGDEYSTPTDAGWCGAHGHDHEH